MPVYQELVDFDDMITKLSNPPVIINDLPNDSEANKVQIQNIISTRFSTNLVSLLPSCRCGFTKGEFSSEEICPKCNTSVSCSIEDDIEPQLWVRKPDGVSKLISPIMLIMLRTRFKKGSFNVIQWLTNTNYKTDVKQPLVINKLLEVGIKRGYNNFVDNFDFIINYLFSLKDFRLAKNVPDLLYDFIIEHRNKIFFDYLPMPNKALLVIKDTATAIYIDGPTINAIDAIEMLVSIDKDFYNQTSKVKQNRTIKALCKLADYHEKDFKEKLYPKPGLFRKHIFGSRVIYAFRAVIVSITDHHNYDEVGIPWSIGITAFRQHLLNKLLKLGMEHNSAVGFLMSHVGVYNPLLDRLLQELVTDSRDGRIWLCLIRNPTMLQGSVQRVCATKFKTNPLDPTISMSDLICNAYNADYDGDALLCGIALDNEMADGWYPLAPHFNILQLDVPDKLSRNINLPAPNVVTIARWLED